MWLAHFKSQTRHLTDESCLSYLLLIDTSCPMFMGVGFFPLQQGGWNKLIWLMHSIQTVLWNKCPATRYDLCVWKVPTQNCTSTINNPLILPCSKKTKGHWLVWWDGSMLIFGIWKADSFTFIRLEQQHHPRNINQKSWCFWISYIAILVLLGDCSTEGDKYLLPLPPLEN